MSKDGFDVAASGENSAPGAGSDAGEAAKPFPTKNELQDIIARQKQLLEKPDLRLDPPWLHDPDDPVRKELREVSRKRTRMTNRLDQSVKKFEQDFDLSS